MDKPKFAIVVGTSAGGLHALVEFVTRLHAGMDAAVFVVMHLSGSAMSNFLVQRLQQHTDLTCEVAVDGATILPGHIYFASPGSHLLIKNGRVLLGRGPEENRWRPSIDVLFRSAAVEYNTRTIGIVLTGMLDDGTTGMLAIRQSGGVCIVQDPNEAEYPDMPFSVINSIEVDFCLSLAEIGDTLLRLTQTDPTEISPPTEIIIESQIAEKVVVSYDNISELAEKSIYACPDCGGGLWKMSKDEKHKDVADRYRCHIGHAYSENDLIIKQVETFESTLWIALRIMEERRNLLTKIQGDNARKGLRTSAENYERKASEIQIHVDILKEVLYASQKA